MILAKQKPYKSPIGGGVFYLYPHHIYFEQDGDLSILFTYSISRITRIEAKAVIINSDCEYELSDTTSRLWLYPRNGYTFFTVLIDDNINENDIPANAALSNIKAGDTLKFYTNYDTTGFTSTFYKFFYV